MIIKMDPKRLYRSLRYFGPYIYYYNGEKIENNTEIVQNIKLLSIKYPQLKILEINWNDQIKHNYFTSDSIANTVYLYAEGKLTLKKQKPCKKEIENIFEQAIICFNKILDKKAQNLATKPRNKRQTSENELDEIERKTIARYAVNVKYKRNLILKSKIKLESEKPVDKLGEGTHHYSEIKNRSFVNKKYKNDFVNTCIKNTFVNKINDPIKSSKYSLCNIKKSDLPNKIFISYKLKNKIFEKNKEYFKSDLKKLPPKKRYKAQNFQSF